MELGKRGQFAAAEQAFRQALQLAPEHPGAHMGLGMALKEQDRFDAALEPLRRAARLAPRHPNVHVELALALEKLLRTHEAIDVLRAAIDANPQDPEPHGLLAKLLLLSGDFKRGWAEYEWRWKCRGMEARRSFPQPQWTGAKSVRDRTILLYHEQGFGDTMQFSRYVPLLLDRGADVILQAPPELVALMRSLPGQPDVMPLGQPPPRFDFHAPLMSLALAFNTTLKTIPASVPYLAPAKKAAEVWAQRLRDSDAPGGAPPLRVGLTWAGRSTHTNDRYRSIPLRDFAPLAEVPGVAFYSLQKWDPAGEAKAPPAGLRFIDTASRLFDFSDAAALIANLDLVLCVDTAVAHLAGAMAKPAWVMLPYSPDFRWLLGRCDSPWYPTLRLFRQPGPGDWAAVFPAVVSELSAMAASRNRA
jgi:hypothetical protein